MNVAISISIKPTELQRIFIKTGNSLHCTNIKLYSFFYILLLLFLLYFLRFIFIFLSNKKRENTKKKSIVQTSKQLNINLIFMLPYFKDILFCYSYITSFFCFMLLQSSKQNYLLNCSARS